MVGAWNHWTLGEACHLILSSIQWSRCCCHGYATREGDWGMAQRTHPWPHLMAGKYQNKDLNPALTQTPPPPPLLCVHNHKVSMPVWGEYWQQPACPITAAAVVLSRVWLFATRWPEALQAPLFMRLSRQGYWARYWVAISFSRELPYPRMKPAFPALAGRIFTTEPPWKALNNDRGLNKLWYSNA